jgi:2-polyprenyl-3-methyl-5-hydroxy-6-metoxy-1,4-benzoquinol methylase
MRDSLDPADARAERERRAYDEDRVFERSTAWMQRVIHVLEGANTLLGESVFRAAARDAARDADVLDVGCGRGATALALLEYGPRHVLGIDVSTREIDIARQAARGSDRLEFRVQSAQDRIEGRFGLIIGRSVLHHIDFDVFLRRAYAENLLAGGRMIFMEPMGHPLVIAFHRFVRSAHTADERPLRARDLARLRGAFPLLRVHGVNLVSFPAGIVSSFCFATADNRLMRAADRVDRRILHLAPRLAAYARQGIIVIDKPHDRSGAGRPHV